MVSVFKFFDKDGSGGVSFDEFMGAIREPVNERRNNMIARAFGVIDDDGSGIIDMDELKAKFNANEHPLVVKGLKKPQQVTEEMCKCLENESGQIDINEWREYY